MRHRACRPTNSRVRRMQSYSPSPFLPPSLIPPSISLPPLRLSVSRSSVYLSFTPQSICLSHLNLSVSHPSVYPSPAPQSSRLSPLSLCPSILAFHLSISLSYTSCFHDLYFIVPIKPRLLLVRGRLRRMWEKRRLSHRNVFRLFTRVRSYWWKEVMA